jgi:hypothetical protein
VQPSNERTEVLLTDRMFPHSGGTRIAANSERAQPNAVRVGDNIPASVDFGVDRQQQKSVYSSHVKEEELGAVPRYR